MKSRLSLFFTAVFVLSLPFGVQAMSPSEHAGHGAATSEKAENVDAHASHGAAAMHGNMLDLGSISEKGVKANAHLNDVAEAMAKAGRPYTHHFMVMFVNEKSGELSEEGTVAVKIRNPVGEESLPLRLEGMDGHFGADIILEQKGAYEFSVGTALTDGVKRQYQFSFEYK